MKYLLFRMDDHGNRVVMKASDDYEKLDELRKELERRGHKQTYWIETTGKTLKDS